MTERIDIKDAAAQMGCKRRAFIKWCSELGVEILRDPGFKKGYVLKVEFDKAADFVPNKYTQRKYGCSIEEFKARMKFDAELRTALGERKNGNQNTKSNNEDLGEHGKGFLARLTKNNHEQ